MIKAPDLARLKWRLGRRLYMDARGEQRSGAIDRNGETFAQQCVVRNTEDAPKLVVLDIGANQGEWTEHLLMGLSQERRTSRRLAVYAFEPVPATAERIVAVLSDRDRAHRMGIAGSARWRTDYRFSAFKGRLSEIQSVAGPL